MFRLLYTDLYKSLKFNGTNSYMPPYAIYKLSGRTREAASSSRVITRNTH
jgi:hypothetical protein